jgi:two-component system chemotaxis response regulator CheB
MFPSMPEHALERVPDAFVASTAELPHLLAKLVDEEIEIDERTPASRDPLAASEKRFAELDMSEVEKEIHNGKPSSFACPECGGVLWEIDQKGMLRFRCRVGHAYTAEHLRAEQRHAVETALWSALRALEESASLYKRMAERARNAHHPQTRRVYEERAATAENNSRTLRDFLVNVNVSEAEPSGVPNL